MKVFLTWVSVILALDFFGFIIWSLSGQFPIDGFYLGMITSHILRAIF